MGNTVNGKALKAPVTLSKTEKVLVSKNWYKHVHRDEFIGAKVFDQMFSDSPEAKDAFGIFSNIEVNDEHYNEVLHRHGSRVKSSVGRVIDALDDRSDYKEFLHKLGCRHYREYKFDPQYIQVLLQYFLVAIENSMGEDWNSEIKLAFTKLFEIISFHMINSMSA